MILVVTSRRHAFTLIELLAVIAIVLLLLSILLPLLGRLRVRAGRTIDVSNLRQFVSACAVSSLDADGYLPRGERESSYNGAGNGDDLVWCNSGEMFGVLTNYCNDRHVFSCIGFQANGGWKNYPASYGAVGSWGGFVGWTYLVRRRESQAWPMVNKDGSPKGSNYVHLTRLGSPSTSRTMAGCMSWTGPVYAGQVSHRASGEEMASQPTSGYPFFFAPDLEGLNIGYADGSAAWVSFADAAIVKDVDFMLYDPRRR
jgi:prepilin-type N-terminal cleavage/methylation domain-containing protein